MKFQSGFRNGLLVQYIASITCALASMSFGLTNGWMSPFLPHLLSDSSLIPMTSSEASWCAVASQLGCLIGAFIAANLADRIGRKYTILMMAPMVFACQIGIGYVRHVWYLFLLRMIIGIADGSCSTTIPMYVGEIASPDIRGFLSSLTCLFFISGTLTMNIIGSYLSIWTCSLICACIPAVHFAAFIFMPESPYYYIKRKKYELAERSLKIFQGSTNVTKDMEVLKEAIRSQEESATSPKFTDLFTVPSIRKATIIFVILCVSLRATAKAPMMSYTRFVFEETGSTISPIASTISCSVTEVIVVICTTYFIIDRFGKKLLAIISLGGCSVTLFVMGMYFYLKDYHDNVIDHLNWLPVTTLVSYYVVFSIGISFVPICYLSELFPTNVKANALSFAEVFLVSTGAATIKVFQMMNDGFGTLWVTFFFFSLLSVCSLCLVVKFVPETRGQTLEEIQLYLKGSTEGKKQKYREGVI